MGEVRTHRLPEYINCSGCGAEPKPAGSLGGLAWWCPNEKCRFFQIHIHHYKWNDLHKRELEALEDAFNTDEEWYNAEFENNEFKHYLKHVYEKLNN